MTLAEKLEAILLNLKEKALDPDYSGGVLSDTAEPTDIKMWLMDELDNQLGGDFS